MSQTHIQIPDAKREIAFDAFTGTGPLVFTFVWFQKTDINVYVDDVLLDQNAWSVVATTTLVGGYSGGTVTLNDAVTNKNVVISLATRPGRTTDFASGGAKPQDVNSALDKLHAIVRDLETKVDRSIQLRPNDNSGPIYLARPAQRALKIEAWDATGTVIEYITRADVEAIAAVTGEIQVIAENIADVVAVADADVIADLNVIADPDVLADLDVIGADLLLPNSGLSAIALDLSQGVLSKINAVGTDLLLGATSDVAKVAEDLFRVDSFINEIGADLYLGASGLIYTVATDLQLGNASLIKLASEAPALTDADRIAAENAQAYSEEWANKAEDSPVSIAAGGDGATEFSALHWAAKTLADALSTAADRVAVDNQSDLIASFILTLGLEGLTPSGVAALENLANGILTASSFAQLADILAGTALQKATRPQDVKAAIDALQGRTPVYNAEPLNPVDGQVAIGTQRDGTAGFGAIEAPQVFYGNRWRIALTELSIMSHFGDIGTPLPAGHFASKVNNGTFDELQYVGLPDTDYRATIEKALLAAIEYDLPLNFASRYLGVDKTINTGALFDLDALANSVGRLSGGRYNLTLRNGALMDLIAPAAIPDNRIMFSARKGEVFRFEGMTFHKGMNANLAINRFNMNNMGQDNHAIFDLKDTDSFEGPSQAVFERCRFTGKGGGAMIIAHEMAKLIFRDSNIEDVEFNLDAHLDGPASFNATNDVLNGLTVVGGSSFSVEGVCKFQHIYARYAAAGTGLYPVRSRAVAVQKQKYTSIKRALFQYCAQSIDLTGGSLTEIGQETILDGNFFYQTYDFPNKLANTQGRCSITGSRAKFTQLAFAVVGTNPAFPDSLGPRQVKIFGNSAEELGRIDSALIPADHNGGAGYGESQKAFVLLGGQDVNGIPFGVDVFGNSVYDENSKITTWCKADRGWRYIPTKTRQPNLAPFNSFQSRNRAFQHDKAFNPRVECYLQPDYVEITAAPGGTIYDIPWDFTRHNHYRMFAPDLTFDPLYTVDLATNTFDIPEHGLVDNDTVDYHIGPNELKTSGVATVVAAAMAGLTDGATYHVINATADTFQLAATSGGAAIDITSHGAAIEHSLIKTSGDKTRLTIRYGQPHLLKSGLWMNREGNTANLSVYVQILDAGGTALTGPQATARGTFAVGESWAQLVEVAAALNNVQDETFRIRLIVYGDAADKLRLRGANGWKPNALSSYAFLNLDATIASPQNRTNA